MCGVPHPTPGNWRCGKRPGRDSRLWRGRPSRPTAPTPHPARSTRTAPAMHGGYYVIRYAEPATVRRSVRPLSLQHRFVQSNASFPRCIHAPACPSVRSLENPAGPQGSVPSGAPSQVDASQSMRKRRRSQSRVVRCASLRQPLYALVYTPPATAFRYTSRGQRSVNISSNTIIGHWQPLACARTASPSPRHLQHSPSSSHRRIVASNPTTLPCRAVRVQDPSLCTSRVLLSLSPRLSTTK